MSSLDQPLDYLAICAHPDDAELGIGGTILLLKEQGFRVGVLDLTSGEPTPFGSEEIRRRETEQATRILGVDWRGNLGLTNRALVADLDARKRLAGQIRLLRPRILLSHYWIDSHPDHVAASALVDAARFWGKLSKTDMPGEPWFAAKIVYYFSVHLRLHVEPTFVLDISPYIERKMEALGCYASQFNQGRPIGAGTVLDEVRDVNRYWGWTINRRYGEPFVTRERVGLKSLGDLL